MQASRQKKSSIYNNLGDFLPISLYYTHDAVLTKNGELIKVIKVNYSVESSVISKIILDFLSSSLQNDISIWITTIRGGNRSAFQTNFYDEEKFSSYNFESKFLSFSGINSLENELFISIVIHDHVDLVSFKNLISIISEFDKKFYTKRLNSIYKKLTSKTEKLLNALANFSPEVLSIKEINNYYVSEIETFFSRISKSSTSPELINKIDISTRAIRNNSVKFSENSIRLNNGQKDEIFSTIFTIKSHGILKNNISTNLLSGDFDMIVTEIIIPTERLEKKYTNYLKNIKELKNFTTISQDKNLTEYTSTIHSKDKQFLKQTTFMIFGSKEDIDYKASKMNQKFIKHGIHAYRENLAIEETFWSQFPGNFNFVTRLNPQASNQLCNFNHSNLRSEQWYNSISFPDYALSGERFVINQKNKNICLMFSNKDLFNDLSFFINISLSKFSNLRIINFSTKKTPLSNQSVKDGAFLKILSTTQQDSIRKLIQDYMILISAENMGSDFSDELIKSFIDRKQIFNLVNLVSYLMNKNIITEDLSQVISHQENQNIKFYNPENLTSTQYLNLLILNCMVASVDKLINNNDYLMQCHSFEIIINDKSCTEKITKLLELVPIYGQHIYIYYDGTEDLVTLYKLNRPNLLLFFSLNELQKPLFNIKSFAFSAEVKNYLDYLVNKKITAIAVNFDGRTFFSVIDIKKFLNENNYTTT